jgi:PhnB protein
MAIVAHLIVNGGAEAVEYYKAALGAVEVRRVPEPNGPRLMHAELEVGGGKLYLCDDFPEHCGGVVRAPSGPGSVVLHLDVPDADAAIARAAAAGATVKMPASDMFWGDRYGQIVDPFGHTWSFAHRLAHAAAA